MQVHSLERAVSILLALNLCVVVISFSAGLTKLSQNMPELPPR